MDPAKRNNFQLVRITVPGLYTALEHTLIVLPPIRLATPGVVCLCHTPQLAPPRSGHHPTNNRCLCLHAVLTPNHTGVDSTRARHVLIDISTSSCCIGAHAYIRAPVPRFGFIRRREGDMGTSWTVASSLLSLLQSSSLLKPAQICVNVIRVRASVEESVIV